jgi:hypothetical protein
MSASPPSADMPYGERMPIQRCAVESEPQSGIDQDQNECRRSRRYHAKTRERPSNYLNNQMPP